MLQLLMNLLKIVSLLIVISITLFASFSPSPNWELTTYKENDHTSYTLRYAPWNNTAHSHSKPLLDCLSKIDGSFAIRIMLPLKRCKVQDEINAYYRKNLPKILNYALKSSANMHDPTLKPLIDNFSLAFKSTSLYKHLDNTLQNRGYTLEEEFSFEKFRLFKKKEPYVFHADIWLRANPISH